MIFSISCGEWSHLISGILVERASVVCFEEELLSIDDEIDEFTVILAFSVFELLAFSRRGVSLF